MSFVGGWAIVVAVVVLHACTTLCFVFVFVFFCPPPPSSGAFEVCQSNIRGGRARVGEGAHISIVALINLGFMRGILGAHRAMCCAKVVSKSEFVVQRPIDCNGLPRNGVGHALAVWNGN